MENLEQFIANAKVRLETGFPSNAYVTEPCFDSLYVRLTRRYLGRVVRPLVLDLANVVVQESKRGKGVFTSLVGQIERLHPELTIYIENVTTERFAIGLLKLGFSQAPSIGFGSFYKVSAS